MNDDERRQRVSQQLRQAFSKEDLVIVSVIAFGLLGSVLLYLLTLPIPPIIVAVMLGASVSSLVYRFLGGIHEDTTFAVGVLKLSGTMAALIGSAAFFNVKLEQQTSVDLDRLFDPHIQTWYAMDIQRSVPITVSIAGRREAIGLPDTNALGKASLDLAHIDGEYTVLAEEAKAYRLGQLTVGDLTKAGLFNTFAIPSDRFVVTERLPADSTDIDLNPLPLTLTTGTYGGEFSRYRLQTPQGTMIFDGAIRGRGIELATVEGRRYLVAVVELNHVGVGDTIPPYAKFAIGEIKTRLEP